MSAPPVDPKARIVKPSYDNRGNAYWELRMSRPDDSFAQCLMVPDRIIPIIFVPGVMGSNLKGIGEAEGTNWTLNSSFSMASWFARGAEDRKRVLTPATMVVDDAGNVRAGTQQSEEELRRRKWGEVGAMSYGDWLVWLENALNDYDDPHAGERVKLMKDQLQALVGETLLLKEEVGLSYKYRFPVHACGYNWLASNTESAMQLGKRIDEIIQRYSKEKKKCEKVILVTHSMGGLVARHCSEVGNYRDKILGIVHGVMPTIGAAAVYRRFKAGTEGAYIPSEVMGNDAAEMTAVLSSAPGPMQLLPTPEYGNGWLKIKDGATEHSFPQQGDPYGEIYTVRGKWWSMCDDRLINPLNVEQDPKKRQAVMDADWATFASLITKEVFSFHRSISGRYHPNTHAFIGVGNKPNSFGQVNWQRLGPGRAATDVLSARPVNLAEIKESRSTMARLLDSDRELARSFMLQGPDERGDGTVPLRSGLVVKDQCRSFLQVDVGHEPAYKFSEGAENLRACRFTLRAIVKIAQDVKQTSLKYD